MIDPTTRPSLNQPPAAFPREPLAEYSIWWRRSAHLAQIQDSLHALGTPSVEAAALLISESEYAFFRLFQLQEEIMISRGEPPLDLMPLHTGSAQPPGQDTTCFESAREPTQDDAAVRLSSAAMNDAAGTGETEDATPPAPAG